MNMRSWWSALCTKLRGSDLMPPTPKVPSAAYLHEQIRDLRFEVEVAKSGRRSAEMHAQTLTSLLAAKRMQAAALEEKLAALAHSTSTKIITLEREVERLNNCLPVKP